MINKIYKTIHNKYSKIFKFIFFLRYLLIIFFISVVLFLTIPSFFDYEKGANKIKNALDDHYKFKIIKYEKIKFYSLPKPRLEFENALINLGSPSIKLNVNNLRVYPNILSIYNFDNFQINKIVLKDNNTFLTVSDLNYFTKNLLKQKNKLLIDSLTVKIRDKKNLITKIKNIKFSNYGYDKNIIKGNIFEKKFQINIFNDYNSINFKLLNSGVSGEINFDKNQIKKNFSGIVKSRILNTNLKFYFYRDARKLKLSNLYFRSKSLSFNGESKVLFEPFLDFESTFEIEQFNKEILETIDFNKFLDLKEIIKKINTRNKINFRPKKLRKNLIDELNLEFAFAYGRLNYSKKLVVPGGFLNCVGDVNFLEEFPVLFFDCFLTLSDKQKFFKKFSIKTKKNNETIKLNVKGNLNILNKNVYFNKISIDGDYNTSKEDLKYFKTKFEEILYDKSFSEIFNFKKIKKFILEVS